MFAVFWHRRGAAPPARRIKAASGHSSRFGKNRAQSGRSRPNEVRVSHIWATWARLGPSLGPGLVLTDFGPKPYQHGGDFDDTWLRSRKFGPVLTTFGRLRPDSTRLRPSGGYFDRSGRGTTVSLLQHDPTFVAAFRLCLSPGLPRRLQVTGALETLQKRKILEQLFSQIGQKDQQSLHFLQDAMRRRPDRAAEPWGVRNLRVRAESKKGRSHFGSRLLLSPRPACPVLASRM